MWQRKRTWLLLLALTLAALAVYFEPTRCVRGWLLGEAFFDGRPTSYWAVRCDEWLDRFDDADSVKLFTYGLPYKLEGEELYRMWIPDDGNWLSGHINPPPDTMWKRVRDWTLSKEERERDAKYQFAPPILWGSPDTEPVLRELERDERFRRLAEFALTRIECYHKCEEVAAKQVRESAP